jgi:hypothetical protein
VTAPLHAHPAGTGGAAPLAVTLTDGPHVAQCRRHISMIWSAVSPMSPWAAVAACLPPRLLTAGVLTTGTSGSVDLTARGPSRFLSL